MARTNPEMKEKIVTFIANHTKQRGYPPSVREIGEAVGLRSPSTVHGYLARLEKEGKIERDASKTRGIRVPGQEMQEQMQPPVREDAGDLLGEEVMEIPVLGQVAAGMPILAEENVEEIMYMPMAFARAGEVFMLRVKGSSMINVGIMNGDYVIVAKRNFARNGEIVVALLEDEATVKRFYQEDGHFRLQPENDEMEPIYADEVKVLGKVVGVLRMMI